MGVFFIFCTTGWGRGGSGSARITFLNFSHFRTFHTCQGVAKGRGGYPLNIKAPKKNKMDKISVYQWPKKQF